MPLCFEIIVNDGEPVVAGAENIGVLTALVTFVASRNDLTLSAGGLISRGPYEQEHLDWAHQDLKPGDRISIRVVESGDPSEPIARTRDDPAATEQQERAYYEHLKAKYGRK